MKLFKKICQNQIGRHFLLLYSFTFFVFLPIICRKLQYSPLNFTKPNSTVEQIQMIQENKIRLANVRKRQAFLTSTGMLAEVNTLTKPVDMTIMFITTNRNQYQPAEYKPYYLTQVVWQMLWLLYEAKQSGFQLNVFMSVCNVDGRPESHTEVTGLPIPAIAKYQHDQTSYKNWNIFEKEKQDYIFCLNASFAHNAAFALLVEDDAYANDELFVVLHEIFRTRFGLVPSGFKSTPEYRGKKESITYVKLYHPDRLLSYISLERNRLPELFALSALMSTVSMLIYTYRLQRVTRHQTNMIWLCFAIYTALVLLAIGRPHVASLRLLFTPYLHSYVVPPDCCTPAMLFPRKGARDVIDHLGSHLCYKRNAKDTVLNRWIRNERRTTYSVQPNLFTHIGWFSSVRGKFVSPRVAKQ